MGAVVVANQTPITGRNIWLAHVDSNHERQSQSLLSYHYSMSQ